MISTCIERFTKQKRSNRMKKSVIFICLFGLFAAVASAAPTTLDNSSLNAPICAKCHQEESNMMLGFLKDVSFKANTILMDLLTRKEVVYFDEDSRIKNLESLEDMRKYKGKGFRIYFAEEDGRKFAVHITRFDILQLVDDNDKLSMTDVEKLMQSSTPPTLVDVRPGKHYMAGHIQGAINVPAPAFEKFKNRLPKNKNQTLVIYGVGGCLSPSVAVNAMAMGYNDVRIYTSGFPEWNKHHYGVASAKYVKQGLTDNSLVILDLQQQENAINAHIPGATAAPFVTFTSIKKKLPGDRKAPIILYGPNQEDAALILKKWGYKMVRLLEGDFTGWQQANFPVAQGDLTENIVYIPKPQPGVISADEFKRLVATSGNVSLLDVRNSDEFSKSHIPGSINIAVDDLEDHLAELQKDKPVITFCNSGVRAEMAYNILKNKGYDARYLNAALEISAEGKPIIEE